MKKGEKISAFPPRSSQECLLSLLLLNIVLEVASATRQLKEIKSVKIGKEEVKLSLFPEDVFVYAENHKGFAKQLLELKREFRKV